MENMTIASLVTSAASLTTVVAALAFSQVSSDRRIAQVALGSFTFLAASISATSLLGTISYFSDEGEKEGDIVEYGQKVLENLPTGCAFTLFGLSILAVTHAAQGALKKLSNP